jgi:Phage Mu protein F like protein
MTSPARAILDAKLALEQEVQRPILSVCTRYIEVWVQSQGHIPAYDRLASLTQLEKVLLRHYARTVMVMTGRRPPRDPQLHVAVRKLAHMDSLRSRAKHQAMLIIRGIDRELAAGMVEPGAIGHHDDGTTNYGKGMNGDGNGDSPFVSPMETKADATSRVYGVTAGYIGKLKEAAVNTLQKLKSKIGTISNVNTNAVAEQARDLQIEVVKPNEANGYLEKTWNSLMDGRERPTHHEAHGQTVAVTEAFDVGGSELRFPGDASLGAPLKEIINCRCYLTHEFVKDDGTRTPIHVGPSAPTRRTAPLGPGKPSVMQPTSTVTLNGTTRARIILGDGQTFGTLRQPKPNTVEVLVNRRVIGRASIVNGHAVNITVENAYGNQGIRELIERSVEHSAAR